MILLKGSASKEDIKNFFLYINRLDIYYLGALEKRQIFSLLIMCKILKMFYLLKDLLKQIVNISSTLAALPRLPRLVRRTAEAFISSEQRKVLPGLNPVMFISWGVSPDMCTLRGYIRRLKVNIY